MTPRYAKKGVRKFFSLAPIVKLTDPTLETVAPSLDLIS